VATAARPAASDGTARIVILGRQGSGKGTQAERLSVLYGVPHLSTGEFFRAAIRARSDVGLEAQAYMDRGELVPDHITVGVVTQTLSTLPGGFILDGFPRNLAQAQALAEMVQGGLDVVVNLEASLEEVLRRLSARGTCTKCGTGYNLGDNPPRVAGVCDLCGGPVAQRDDDTVEAIRRRLEIYESETAPLVNWYQAQGLLTVVDAVGPPDEVTDRLVQAIEAARPRRVG
jgi:adenylate kinase